jgi:signal transduction histidine kinase
VTQPPSADVVPSGSVAQPTAGRALALRNWRVARQLLVLVLIPAVLILAFTGLWVTHEVRSAQTYGRVARLSELGQQVGGLAQAIAGERAGTAAFLSNGRPATGLAALQRRYAITDAQAARVRRQISQLGSGYPAQTRAAAAQVLASITKLPGLRRQAAHSGASALAVITGYSAATSGLFPVIDGIADLSGNSTLVTSVRALGSLSRAADQASQQQAILGGALTAGRFGPGALTALITAQARQASDLDSFRSSATAEESRALTQTLASPQPRQAQAVEQRAIAAGNGALALGPQASQQWSTGMSATVGWMGRAQQQLAGWTTAYAQALQQSAMRSAMIAGGAGLAALALVLLGTIFAARSMVRRLRRLEAAALEGPGARLPINASAVSADFFWRNHALLERLLRLIDSLELREHDPERLASLLEMDHLATRIWHNSDSALVLAGHELPPPAGPLALVDVLRAAASQVEQYGRVLLDAQQGVWVSASATTDTAHLLAELLENATTFSPETTRVIVSGHAVVAGGALVTITDDGTGIPDEELERLNWQLANPSLAEVTSTQQMGLLAVALLAARHGISVMLSAPPDGGTTAEVYLPATLISLGAAPVGWQGGADEALPGGASEEAGVTDQRLSALRFASGQEPPAGLEADAPEAVPALLGAPMPAPAPGTSTSAAEPDPVDAESGDGPPIFESVRSGYLHTFDRDVLRISEEQADERQADEEQASEPPAGQSAAPPASRGDGSDGAANGPPTAGPPPSPGSPTACPPPSPSSPIAGGPPAPSFPTAGPPPPPSSPTAGPPPPPSSPTAGPPPPPGSPTAEPPPPPSPPPPPRLPTAGPPPLSAPPQPNGDRPPSSPLPQRAPQAGQVRDEAGDQETP